MPGLATRRIASVGSVAFVLCAAIAGCDRQSPGNGSRSSTAVAARSAEAMLPPPDTLDCHITPPTEWDRLHASLVVQTSVLAWDPDFTHAGGLEPPAIPIVVNALDLLRCDTGRRAVSRHARAIAKIFANDWALHVAKPYLRRLGFPNDAAIDHFKARVAHDFPEPVFLLHMHDHAWLEFAILRRLTTAEQPPGRMVSLPDSFFGPSLAYAQTSSCWKPEEPSGYTYVVPYVELTAHVSVDVPQTTVKVNVDPQEWDRCGRFWSPPDPSSTTTPPTLMDGAKYVAHNWGTSPNCHKPAGPWTDAPAEPGIPLPNEQYLWEYFYVPGIAENPVAWFNNILPIMLSRGTRTLPNGNVVSSHVIDYALYYCDAVDGALGGDILGMPMKTILDTGQVHVWRQGGRTHVAATKTFEFDSAGTTWLTQLNPALRELNEQLGEMACCL